MNMRRLAAVVLCAAVWLWVPGQALAQGPGGTLSGRVLDPSGSAMPGVTVTATRPATGETRTALTGSEGTYQIECGSSRPQVKLQVDMARRTQRENAALARNHRLSLPTLPGDPALSGATTLVFRAPVSGHQFIVIFGLICRPSY